VSELRLGADLGGEAARRGSCTRVIESNLLTCDFQPPAGAVRQKRGLETAHDEVIEAISWMCSLGQPVNRRCVVCQRTRPGA
jgi:hypothetical protein